MNHGDGHPVVGGKNARRKLKRDTVALCEAYGRGNAGDEAILRAILQEIREQDPDVPVCAWYCAAILVNAPLMVSPADRSIVIFQSS